MDEPETREGRGRRRGDASASQSASRRPAHRVPGPERRRASPTLRRVAARSRRRVQDLQEHARALRRPRPRPRDRGPAHRPDRHRLRRRRRRRRGQGAARLRPDQPEPRRQGRRARRRRCSPPTTPRALADLPPREVLLAQLAGALAAPMQQFAGLLQALPRNFAYGLRPSSTAGRRHPAPPPTAEPAAEPSAAAEAPRRRSRGTRSRGSTRAAEAAAAADTETDTPTEPSRRTPRPTHDHRGELRPWPPRKRSSTPSPA